MKLQLLAVACIVSCLAVSGQQIEGFSAPVKSKQFVVYAAEEQTVPAGKKGAVDLQFHVIDGYHVNSHRPKSELQIRTELKLDEAAGVTTGDPTYPGGKPYRLADETLDVYTGAFAVTVPILATAGGHSIHGVLRYQACDKSACYPVRALPVELVVQAK